MKNAKRIVLALGSNVGNRRENLVRALAEIENFARILSRSKIYETAPVGFADQRDFLNAAVLCETQFERWIFSNSASRRRRGWGGQRRFPTARAKSTST